MSHRYSLRSCPKIEESDEKLDNNTQNLDTFDQAEQEIFDKDLFPTTLPVIVLSEEHSKSPRLTSLNSDEEHPNLLKIP